MAAVSELWVSWFTCCVTQPQKRRHRIDRYLPKERNVVSLLILLIDIIPRKRETFPYTSASCGKAFYELTFLLILFMNLMSMIGEPTNFQHTAHIGSRDVEMPNDQLTALQMQMKSKGGYETTYKEPDWCQ